MPQPLKTQQSDHFWRVFCWSPPRCSSVISRCPGGSTTQFSPMSATFWQWVDASKNWGYTTASLELADFDRFCVFQKEQIIADIKIGRLRSRFWLLHQSTSKFPKQLLTFSLFEVMWTSVLVRRVRSIFDFGLFQSMRDGIWSYGGFDGKTCFQFLRQPIGEVNDRW